MGSRWRTGLRHGEVRRQRLGKHERRLVMRRARVAWPRRGCNGNVGVREKGHGWWWPRCAGKHAHKCARRACTWQGHGKAAAAQFIVTCQGVMPRLAEVRGSAHTRGFLVPRTAAWPWRACLARRNRVKRGHGRAKRGQGGCGLRHRKGPCTKKVGLGDPMDGYGGLIGGQWQRRQRGIREW